ncbi:hypothetical protein PAESOLCIP111_02197 [Paenibacillus solanacearum]|uniref:Iron ABC transporter substrate-binding protein n=1 Tax=Paenibacillus solanacearum TaxID=2048548 RepID=A0A916K257_9BACL|nr:hypothetical protein [Paenibacillus solanacearum]CAG7619262.1 hypothetical protein PAESOLCIP111_02197 [Paenibacillus solanacearum]
MRQRKSTVLIWMLAVSVVTSACGGAASGTVDKPKEETPTADPAAQPAELVIYDTTGEKLELLMDKYGNKLKERFPK